MFVKPLRGVFMRCPSQAVAAGASSRTGHKHLLSSIRAQQIQLQDVCRLKYIAMPTLCSVYELWLARTLRVQKC